ncbi:HD-GYP domain-containing protein [Paenibacillus taiwanensis]|uniref:HD-GYP domain-containing protein n=1 Tax=Paenibacillus taiwanensis TaxID=401638 RepID=UPI00048B14A8|nr:HD-GYP domain-containing protein [Paenibacillus taiwanensis]
MRYVPITACQSGMRLAKKVYNEEGMVLLSENVELSDSFIKRLRDMGVSYVYVEDMHTEGINAPNILSEETRKEANRTIRGEFKRLMTGSVLRKQSGPSDMNGAFSRLLDNIIDDISSHEDAMVMLGDIQTADLYVFKHSLNVCVYTTMFGIHHGYAKEELKMLAMGALLHDIGKTQLDLQILNKPGRLSDYEFSHIKSHAELGFRILKNEPNIPLIVAHCAYQHHERLNGSGYPRGIVSEHIHEYAKWIAIADSFDAMTSHRVYRSAMQPHEALEILYTGSGTLYDQSMLALFRDRIAVYPLGMTVELSTGEVGIISKINSKIPQRPIVRLLLDPEGKPYPDMRDIDLSLKLNVVITGYRTDIMV